jgi:hypothetical protein
MINKRAVLLIATLISFLIFTACGANKEEIQSEFSTMLSQERITSEHIRKTAEFLDENIGKLNEEEATVMVVAYEEYINRFINEYDDEVTLQSLGVYFDYDKGYIDTEKIEVSELKTYYEDIKYGCLMVKYYEEALELRVDYTKLLKKYGEHISDSIYRLYELNADITERPMTENASLLISWEELLDRAFRAESLINDYPEDEIIRENVMWLYKSYLNSLLMGATNTPIFNYSTQEFSEEAKQAYISFITSHPDSTITWMLKEYFTYLNSIDYKLNFNDSTMSKVFFDTCDWLVSEAEKRVLE